MNRFILMTFFLLVTATLTGQHINKEIKIENQQPFLVGQIDVAGLSTNTYKSWYTRNHETYKVNTAVLKPLKDKLAEYKILVFMGTWCGDSKREVPRFIKILEAANFPMENLKIVALDHRKGVYKKSPTGEEWGLRIKRVPTFIFYKNGKETNRIIESPKATLEEDIKAIITNVEYIPNYPKSLYFD